MYWSTLLKIWKYNVLFKFQIYPMLEIETAGYTSRVPNTSLHVIFLDYDNITAETQIQELAEKRLIEELRFLQEEFTIGNFYVLETRNKGRHAVCIDALRFVDVKEIVDFSSCDLKFKKAPRINEYRAWVLRSEKKGDRDAPKFIYTVESPHEGENLQSRAHAKFLLKFGITIDLKNPFGTEEIELQPYKTGMRTAKKELDKDDEN